MTSRDIELLCSHAKSVGKDVSELTVYEIMSLGYSYHFSSMVKAMIKSGRIRCKEGEK